jgi:hypothetical protein
VTTESDKDKSDNTKIPRLNRPLVVREIVEVHPRAAVDRTLHVVPPAPKEEKREEPPKRCRYCFGIMPCEEHAEVLNIGIGTRAELDPAKVLIAAHNADLTEVVVLGFKRDGSEFFSSSDPDAAGVMFHCQRAIYKLNVIMDEMAGERNGDGNIEPPDAA